MKKNTAEKLALALRLILNEVTPGIRPYSGDSYLPEHLIEIARQALEDVAQATAETKSKYAQAQQQRIADPVERDRMASYLVKGRAALAARTAQRQAYCKARGITHPGLNFCNIDLTDFQCWVDRQAQSQPTRAKASKATKKGAL